MNRIAIYLYKNNKGIIKQDSLYFLGELSKAVDEILFIANGKLNEGEAKKITSQKIVINQREIPCHDFIAYKEGYLRIRHKLEDFDELIFCNSEVFAPLYPFKELFREMSYKEGVDFWGVSSRVETIKGKIEEYLEPSFLVFKKKVFLSDSFREYFGKIKKIKDKNEAEELLKWGLTNNFKEFNFSSYLNEINCLQNAPDKAILEGRCPVIQKEIFETNSASKVFSAIKKTGYNIDFVVEELAKNYSPSFVKTNLNLNFIISDTHREHFALNKSVIITDFEEDVKPYLAELTGICSLINLKSFNQNISYFKQIKDLTKKYEYFLFFMPDKKFLNTLEPALKECYIKHLLDCTIKNRIYLGNLIKIFTENPYIGALWAMEPYMAQEPIVSNKEIEKFYSRYEISIKKDEKFLNKIPGCIWVRKEVLSSIEEGLEFDFETKLNKGMIFASMAQNHGFLGASVSDVDTARSYISNMEYSNMAPENFLNKIVQKFS